MNLRSGLFTQKEPSTRYEKSENKRSSRLRRRFCIKRKIGAPSIKLSPSVQQLAIVVPPSLWSNAIFRSPTRSQPYQQFIPRLIRHQLMNCQILLGMTIVVVHPFAGRARAAGRVRASDAGWIEREKERAGNGDAASPAGPREREKVVALEPRKSRESRRPTAWRLVQRALWSSFRPCS
jgi:hypothetical protein